MGSNNVPTKTYSKRLLLFGIYIYLMSLLRLQKIFRMRDNSTDAILLFMAIFSIDSVSIAESNASADISSVLHVGRQRSD